MGGTGGSAGSGGSGGGAGGRGGTGGTGGSTPIIIIDASATDGYVNPDANCGARSKTAMKVAPDILILLDRSGSMNDDVNNQMCRPDGGMGASMGCGASSKWAQVTPAIMQVVSETETDVNWGLKFFPDNSANTLHRQHHRGCRRRCPERGRDRHGDHGGDQHERRRRGLQRHAHAQRRDRRDDLSADADRRAARRSSSSRPTGCRPARATTYRRTIRRPHHPPSQRR